MSALHSEFSKLALSVFNHVLVKLTNYFGSFVWISNGKTAQ